MNSQLIGFYGSTDGSKGISSLGFLMLDPDCVYVAPPPPPPEPEPKPVEIPIIEPVEDVVDSKAILIGVLVPLPLVIAGGVTGFLLWRRRKLKFQTASESTKTAPVVIK